MVRVPEELPILPLRNVVVFPYMVVPITVGQPRSLRLVEEVAAGERSLGLVTMTAPNVSEPGPEMLFKVGTFAKVLKVIKSPDKSVRLIVQGVERINIVDWVTEVPFLKAHVEPNPEDLRQLKDPNVEAQRRLLIDLFTRLVNSVNRIPQEVLQAVNQAEDARQMAYLMCSSLQIELKAAQDFLEIEDLSSKLSRLTEMVNRELEVSELGKKIQSQAKLEIDKNQREYLLREQLKAIKKELGENEETQARHEELRKKIETMGMSEEARKEALRELNRLERLNEASAEYGVIQTYLDWMVSLPWDVETEDSLDVKNARQVLNEDHYDLEKIKERLLEFLAVRKLKADRRSENEPQDGPLPNDGIRRDREGAILCFVGPPGVGKTSLGQSIARAMGRHFTRLSLGGVRDEAEIRGHRRTYIGALPGRFIQVLRRIGSKNPVIMLDEVDKLGNDWRGDPSSALLEVLDPEQNREFRDHYLDVAFDLSQVMFIATANVLENIPAPLRDRMEVIQLSGYTELEKTKIASEYLLPRQIRENGLFPEEISFSKEALVQLIRHYTREAGVRNLERQIGSVCRKVAVLIAEGKVKKKRVRGEDIGSYLGKPLFFSEIAERTSKPGVATGLAYTPVGGDILFVEATRMQGKKGLTITGQLGEDMKESAQAALSLVRSNANQLGIDPAFYEESDIHIHVPAGAIPKDGPSAGVTLVTALASLISQRAVRPDLGMTGEITLRGKVMPVGGIKEKILAAHRAGLKTIILPAKNEKDLDDLLPEIRKKMKFILVDEIDQVLAEALESLSPNGQKA
ncbi:MAG: endopeptidase La [Acidobacteria bacterium]|nr:endopeptidase La [Acidobacteriota bacterium]